MDEMNPKMTEFLAQDRIAGFRNDAAGHDAHRAAKATSMKTLGVLATRHMTAFALTWRRVREAIAV